MSGALPLTARQQQVLDYIRLYQRVRRGISPSLQQIADACGMKSLATAHSHLAALAAKGWIDRTHNARRSIRLTGVCEHCGRRG